MKKLLPIIISVVMILPLGAKTPQRQITQTDIKNITNEFRSEDDFVVLNFGRVGTWFLKGAFKVAMLVDNDEDKSEARMTRKMVSGIKSMTVVSYEDSSNSVQSRFNQRVDALLSDVEPLIEICDDGGIVRIYGSESGEEYLRDIIVYTPSECALVCLFGKFPISVIGEIISEESL